LKQSESTLTHFCPNLVCHFHNYFSLDAETCCLHLPFLMSNGLQRKTLAYTNTHPPTHTHTHTHTHKQKTYSIYIHIWAFQRLLWSRGIVLAFGTQVRGFKPGVSRRIFKGEKILSTPSFGGEVKPSVPSRRFAACKRYLDLHGSRILDEICRNISRPRRVTPSAARGLSRRWT
jgi:hypothetical protein